MAGFQVTTNGRFWVTAEARGREGWELIMPFAWGREIGVLILKRQKP
jgi:hypothetical protein